MEATNDEHKQWIFQQINYVFEPLMVNIVRDRPENNVSIDDLNVT